MAKDVETYSADAPKRPIGVCECNIAHWLHVHAPDGTVQPVAVGDEIVREPGGWHSIRRKAVE